LIVHKYGGTSMGSTERIRNVAKRVAKWARAGHQMVVVPSAMSGETNRLLGLAKELVAGQPADATGASSTCIAATGEQVSVGLLAIALQAEGMHGRSATPAGRCAIEHRQRLHQGAHRIDRRHAHARPTWTPGRVVIVTGFQGVDAEGNITTLGRGGSRHLGRGRGRRASRPTSA